MKRSKALLGAGAVLVTAALVSPFISALFTEERVEPAPTKSYAKVDGIWTYDCEFPVQRPEQIMLTCADGGMIVTEIKWQTWDSKGATGTGTYSQNMCEPSCAEGQRDEALVNLRLSNLTEQNGKYYLRTLDISTVDGKDLPWGSTNGFEWDVMEFVQSMEEK